MQRAKRDRQVFVATIAACLLISSIAYAWTYGSAYLAYWKYTPEEGDIIFQSLPRSPLVNAIEGVTESPYSHCGIVSREDDRWIVYEALDGVEASPLDQFIFRGRSQGFAVYRLKPEYSVHIQPTIEHVQEFLGRPYDIRYRMDDEYIYCSELIFKAYKMATGRSLGKLVRMGDMNWRPFEPTIRHFEQGPVPLEREMITPKHLAQAEQLILVTAFSINAE